MNTFSVIYPDAVHHYGNPSTHICIITPNLIKRVRDARKPSISTSFKTGDRDTMASYCTFRTHRYRVRSLDRPEKEILPPVGRVPQTRLKLLAGGSDRHGATGTPRTAECFDARVRGEGRMGESGREFTPDKGFIRVKLQRKMLSVERCMRRRRRERNRGTREMRRKRRRHKVRQRGANSPSFTPYVKHAVVLPDDIDSFSSSCFKNTHSKCLHQLPNYV